MFNLGLTKMMRSKIRNPSSAEDTFGQVNTQNWENLKEAVGGDAGFTKIADDLGFGSNAPGAFTNYRNRLRRAYKYSKTGGSSDISEPFNDDILRLYFDKGQDKQ
jgi:hypothetical protein